MLGVMKRSVDLVAPPGDVWRALTTAEGLSAWFDEVIGLDGTRLTVRQPDGTVRDASIEEADEPRRLTLRWAPFARGADGVARPMSPMHTTFTLEQTAAGTRLWIEETDGTAARARVGA